MGTFGRYSGLIAAAHGPWDEAFRRHMRLGGLGRFGNTPDPFAVSCWDSNSKEWQRRYLSLLPHDSEVDTMKVRWLGTLICPKPDPWGRHVLYDVYSLHDTINMAFAEPTRPSGVTIVRTGFTSPEHKIGIAEGYGYFDPPSRPGITTKGAPGGVPYDAMYRIFDAEKAGYSRTHTPHGIAHKGIGAGAVLYAGLAMASIDAGFKGNYSIEGTRSISASALWKSGRNPRAGPLVERAQAALMRDSAGGMVSQRMTMGGGDHCKDDHIQSTPRTGQSCDPPVVLSCLSDGNRGYFTVQDYMNYDFINEDGLRRWGLVVFNVPKIKGEGLITAKREPDEKLPYWARSAWKNEDVKTAFGMKVSPSSLTSQSAALQRYSRSLSDAGLELLSRAAIGPSTALIVKIAAVLQGRDPARAVDFLRREDIASVLAKTGAGKAILAAHGGGTVLEGLGRAAFRDITTAAATAAASPLALTLPGISRSTQKFVDSYPED